MLPLHSNSAFRLGAGCKPVPRGDAGPLLFGDESSVEEKVAGKPILPLCLTLAVSKWSHVKPRSAQGQTRAPQGRTQEAGVQPRLSWGSRKTLPWLQGAGLSLVLLPEGYHSIPCWRTESF